MSEQDTPNPADKILGADWRPPTRALRAKAWADLPDSERDRLERLDRERDENGECIWFQQIISDPDDPEMELLLLRPTDEEDRRCERVGRWLKVARTIPEDNARAIVEEHTD